MAEEALRPRKRPKLSSSVELPDLLWAKVFSYLPLKERFQVSAVCRQWRGISRIPWSDIKRLDVSNIPSAKINSILSLTSVVSAITMRQRKIILDDKSMPTVLTSLESLKFYNVCIAVPDAYPSNQELPNPERLLSEYCGRFPKLSELVLHNVISVDSQGNPVAGMWAIREDANSVRALLNFSTSLGRSLRRLQVTYGWLSPNGTTNLIAALNELKDLECLYLGSDGHVFSYHNRIDTLLTNFLESLRKMQNLRELCLTDLGFILSARHELRTPSRFAYADLTQIAAIVCETLHKLEVFIFASGREITDTGISRLLTDHPTLKILVICGASLELELKETLHKLRGTVFVPVIVPGRKMSSSAGQAPLSCLQVFVGGPFLRYVRFTLPESGAATFTEIDCPMPQFLAKPQVADVFKEIWAAKMIREGPENGGPPWDSPNWSHKFHSTNSLQFHNRN